MEKIAVLYVFHQFNNRVQYFIKNAIFLDDGVDFIVICNDTKCNYDNLFPEYVKIIYRENIGYDFGGWSHAILNYGLHDKYNKFIFVNSSVIGPFLDDKNKNTLWTKLYTDKLSNNIKLFGSTINMNAAYDNLPHVQSYIFCMDSCTLKYLIDCEIFSLKNTAKSLNDAVNQKEILMSRKIIDNNWNIGCLLNIYKGIDFRTNNPIDAIFKNDLMYPRYHNKLWSEYEIIFMKGNRFNY